MLTESDKVILTKYPIAPSKCVVCLRGNDGVMDFIDFQMSLDIYGSVNICVECLVPISQLIGFVNKDLLEEAEEIILDLQEAKQQLEDKNAELNSTIDSLLSVRPDLKSGDLRTNEESDQDSEQPSLDLELELEI